MYSTSQYECPQYFKSYEIEMDYKEKYLKLLDKVIDLLENREKLKDELLKEIESDIEDINNEKEILKKDYTNF